jgi:hypothetical protein
MKLCDVSEYSEMYPLELGNFNGRAVINAYNQGKNDCTQVDLKELLEWAQDEGLCSLTPAGRDL